MTSFPKIGAFRFCLAVASKEVEGSLIAQAEAAGATVTQPHPRDRLYSISAGFFRDLDSHLWEIMRNDEIEGNAPRQRSHRRHSC